MKYKGDGCVRKYETTDNCPQELWKEIRRFLRRNRNGTSPMLWKYCRRSLKKLVVTWTPAKIGERFSVNGQNIYKNNTKMSIFLKILAVDFFEFSVFFLIPMWFYLLSDHEHYFNSISWALKRSPDIFSVWSIPTVFFHLQVISKWKKGKKNMGVLF